MTIWVNQKEHSYDAPLTLVSLVELLGKTKKTGIAIAVNNSVVPKNSWANLSLNDQDKVTIITATQGG